MGQGQPDGAEQVETRLVGIEDAAGDVEVGNGVAVVKPLRRCANSRGLLRGRR